MEGWIVRKRIDQSPVKEAGSLPTDKKILAIPWTSGPMERET